MTSKQNTQHKDVEKFIKDALDSLPSKTPILQKRLLKLLGSELTSGDLDLFEKSVLIDASLAHWDMAKNRKQGQPEIQIYCPNIEEGHNSKTVIDIVSDDYSFLVDSVVAEINKNNMLIDLLLHPILYVEYDSKGEMKNAQRERDDKLTRQSHIHVQIKDTLSPETLKSLEKGLYTALEDVFYANRDWRKMLEELRLAKEELANAPLKQPLREIEKYCSFLEYIADNNFTLLGYRHYEFKDTKNGIVSKTVKGEGLGLLADDVKPAYISENEEGLPRNLQELRKRLDPVSISKTNRISTVHRRVPMDAIAVKTYNHKGEVTGEKLFVGLFTSVTYSRSASSVPYIREKVEDVLHVSGFLPMSHDGKALRHILEKYPRDELFQIETKDLYKTALDILKLQERQRIALFLREDPFGRYISCLVYVPRDRFGTDLREQIIKILEDKLEGECSNFYTTLDDSVFARVMIIIKTSQSKPPKYNTAEIEQHLQEAGQTWPELLSAAVMTTTTDSDEVNRLTLRYGEAFPVSYTSRYRAKQAVFDIDKIENVICSEQMDLDLYRPEDISSKQLRLKIYNPNKPVTLSDVMPILDNMGLRAIAELPFEVRPGNQDEAIWIHDFLLETPSMEDCVDINGVKENFEQAFCRIWYNKMENDSLNRLTLSANLNWHEITILRTYVRYLKQIRFPFSRQYTEKALTDHPKISKMIIALFEAFLNPKNGDNSESMAAECADAIDRELGAVDSLDQDRILRMITSLIEATMRTNYYQRNKDGSAKLYTSIKINCKAVPEIPDPKPFREIFVYSPQVEAVHLRGDKIARGGLRWSDRQEDYRTEILGLMKAQMVKNAVIVPMGSKGGFVVKTPTYSREEFREEGIRCYKTFIQAMLDITDNLNGKKIIPPENVVRRDGDDPYLVVAADKGTATFSDIANELSLSNKFWLGDAFASGGSAGYDHKKMGITARGAWESVKAHFRLLNHNIQEKPFDVIGVGDMGGDVFGNGMLLSKHIRLIGAFNHLHIFCDPNPDAASSFKERKRLFDAVKGWDAYNVKKLSEGGRIYSRTDKLLELTPEIMARFDIPDNKVTPPELIKYMLKARTDLLWFGGIGTYIKSSNETHADVGDKTNDSLRIDAEELRAKVIGEGANLGVTQLGRVEFAERGGRINTDFLDNSGGVDSSDHEVNIKILMSDIMRKKGNTMDTKARNKLLEQMTDDIAQLVLRSNYQQAQAISLVEQQARQNLQLHESFIQDLEREEGLNRKIEGLPSQETIEMRHRAAKGLTRPELCVLLSYAKIGFSKDLLKSDIPDNLEMEEWLIDYFPEDLRKKYRDEIFKHKLHREIIATTMSNSLVNRMGPTFIKSSMSKTGASCEGVAKAYIIVRDAFGLREIWDAIESLDNKVPAEVQLKAMREVANLSQHAITWFLTRLGHELNIGQDTKAYKNGVETLRKNLTKITNECLTQGIEERQRMNEQNGLPKDLAHHIALMPILSSACDIIRISLEQESNLIDTAQTYFQLGDRFHMDWLRQQARYLHSDDHWQKEATNGLVDQLYSCQAGMTIRVLHDTNCKKKQGKSLLDCWMDMHPNLSKQFDPLFAELRRAGSIDLPMLVIAEQRLRALYGG
ncbi:MAG: glutamate dehydrogenase [Micavibrio sp.]|nr:glutamate dehydrogenase [Micavibrio sp.]|tara:strand:- start:18929 stop:23758 length:4830 start_codon:yes stop_codon:yes gene_type:complete